MGSLRTLTVLLTIGTWGVATEGAPPDPTAPRAAPTARPDPPAPPGEYVKAASWLLQSGDSARAAQYIKAADDYNDLLSAGDRATLESMKAKIGLSPAPAPYSAPDPTPAPAFATAVTNPAPAPAAAAQPLDGMSARNAPDDKQTALWLLQQAREAISQARYDEAQAKVDQAKAMSVHWSLFDDTPARVEASLKKARPAQSVATAAAAGAAAAPGDRRQAKARLKEARDALAAGRLDQAEAIANEVASWKVHFGLIEDSPEKVASAVRALRKRDIARNANPIAADASQDFYGILVQESRAALEHGDLAIAEQKAQRAQSMNVVPPVSADRAEAVLHDIAMVKARAGGQTAPVDPSVQPAQGPAPELLPVEAPPTTLALTPAGGPEAAPEAVPSTLPEPLGDPAAAPAAPVASALAPAPAAEGKPGEALLQQATNLMTAGSFDEARKLAEQTKSGGFGLEAQADDLLAQIALNEQGGVFKLYEAALDAIRKQDYDRARALLSEITSRDGVDESLMHKVQDLLGRLPGEKAGTATLGSVNDAEAVKAQKLNVEVGTKVAEARRMLETDPDKAIDVLQKALTAVKAAEVNETARRTMVRRLEVAIELGKKDKAGFDKKMQDKQFKADIEAKRLRILEADKAKKAQVELLMTKAKDAEAMGDLVEAEQFAKRAAEIDPNNVSATAMATVVRMRRRFETDRRNTADKENGVVAQFQAVDAASIVTPELISKSISFPKEFAELTQSRRDLAKRLEFKKDPSNLAVEAKLNEAISLPMDKEQPLSEVIGYLASYTGLNIMLDSKALGEEGLTRETPVQINLSNVKLRTVLKHLLAPLNLTYKVDDGVLLITNPQASQYDTVARAYSVADLVITPHNRRLAQSGKSPNGLLSPADMFPNSPAGVPNPEAVGPQPGTPGFPGGPGATPGSNNGDRANVGPEDFEPLIQLIKASIAPGTWRDGSDESAGMGYGLGAQGAGGAGDLGVVQAPGSITPFYLNLSLIIRHTSEVHDEIVTLLNQLRRLQDLQVSVEVRFITVSDSFFEEIGVDFDFAIQSDVVGKHSSFAVNNPAAIPSAGTATTTGGTATATATAGVSPYLINPIRDHAYPGQQPLVVGTNGPTSNVVNPQFNPNLMIPFVQDSISAITPFNALTANTGASFGLAFLSDLEVYFFLKAVQGDQRSNLVQAPKVTSFNGAFATVSNTVNRYYVSTITPIVSAASVANQLNIGIIPDGVTLFVTPVVSADRRYVRMSLTPFFLNLIEFQSFTTQTGAVGGGGLGGQATPITTTIQLPSVSVTNVNTTVTVPDGGTVLLGGVKRMREQRLEFGVPILSKTPGIDRLFRNIGIGRTTDSLMIMVTPRIIILEEEEERLGIPAVQPTF